MLLPPDHFIFQPHSVIEDQPPSHRPPSFPSSSRVGTVGSVAFGEPPSYAQPPLTPTFLPHQDYAVENVSPGRYAFRVTADPGTTILQQMTGNGDTIYHVTNERPTVSRTALVTIKRGPPDRTAKTVATFELDGRDTFIVRGKRLEFSKVFSVGPGTTGQHTKELFSETVFASKYTKQLICKYDNFYARWTRDLSSPLRPALVCHTKAAFPLTANPGSPTKPVYARLWLADKMRAVWDPSSFLADPELEIYPDGLERLDDLIVCVVALLLERPEMVPKLTTLSVL